MFLLNDINQAPRLLKHYFIQIFLFSTLFSFGQFSIIKDINQEVQDIYDGRADFLDTMNQQLYFASFNTSGKNQIYHSLGASQTTQVAINSINGHSNYHPENIKNCNGILYFSGMLPNGERELFKSDGTDTGTFLVKDINSGLYGSRPYRFHYINNKLFFVARNDSLQRYELWCTDGSTQNTFFLKDFAPSSIGSFFSKMKVSGNYLYFTRNNHHELWRTDGSASGTIQLFQSNSSATINDMEDLNGVLYFTFDGNGKLYRSYGTAATTSYFYQAGTTNPNAYMGGARSLSVNNGYLYFVTDVYNGGNNLYLYKTNGSTPSAVIQLPTNSFNSRPIISFGNYIAFFVTISNINKLYISDGTSAGTTLLSYNFSSEEIDDFHYYNNNLILFLKNYSSYTAEKIFKISPSSSTVTSIASLTNNLRCKSKILNNHLFFSPQNEEIQKLDLTTNNLSVLKNMVVGNKSSLDVPTEMCYVNGYYYFAANDSIHGRELWKTNGTDTGTVLVKDLKPGSQSTVFKSMISYNNHLYFIAKTYTNYNLYKSDGTTAGTSMLMSTPIGYRYITPLNGRIIAFSSSLKSYDANNGSALTLAYASAPVDIKNRVLKYNNKLYCTGTTTSANKVFVTNGFISGTYTLATNVFATRFFVFQNRVYFTGVNSSGYNVLYKVNTIGTSASLVYATTSSSYYHWDNIATTDSLIYFVDRSSSTGHTLWKSDGTSNGTQMIKTIVPQGYYLIPKIQLNVLNDGNKICFAGRDNYGFEMWVSDGSVSGTHIIKDLNIGSSSAIFNDYNYIYDPAVVFDKKLYSLAKIGNYYYLYETDGTASGTRLIKNFGHYGVGSLYGIDSLIITGDFRRLYQYNPITDTVELINVNYFATYNDESISYFEPHNILDSIFVGYDKSSYGFEPMKFNKPKILEIEPINTSMCNKLEYKWFIDPLIDISQGVQIYLSDSSGSFASQTILISSNTLKNYQKKTSNLSSNIVSGNHYRLKIVCGNYSKASKSFIINNNQITINPIAPKCTNSLPDTLNNISPPIGSYYGNAVSNGVFYPSNAVVGPNKVYYQYQNSNCSLLDSFIIQVNDLPIVTMDTIASNICSNAFPITLTGQPSGGIFSGSGVYNNNLYPDSANIGLNKYYYQYTNSNNCTNKDSIFFRIYLAPYLNLGNDTTICAGNSITLTTGYNFAAYWYGYGQHISLTVDTTGFGLGYQSIECLISDSNCSNNDTIVINFINCTSIEEIQDNTTIIYPNPFTKGVFIKSNINSIENIKYQVISLEGKVVSKGRIANSENVYFINLENLPPGVYYLRVIGNNTSSSKIIKL